MSEATFTPEIETKDSVMIKLEGVAGKVESRLGRENPEWVSKLKDGETEDYRVFLKQMGNLLVVRPGVGNDSVEEQLDFYTDFFNDETKQNSLKTELEKVKQNFKVGVFPNSQEKAPEIEGVSSKVDCVSATFILAEILKKEGVASALYFIGDPTHPRLIVEIKGEKYDISANAPKVSGDVLGTDFSIQKMDDRHLELGRKMREKYGEITEWEGWPMKYNEKTLKGWMKYRDITEKGMEPPKVQIGNKDSGNIVRRKISF